MHRHLKARIISAHLHSGCTLRDKHNSLQRRRFHIYSVHSSQIQQNVIKWAEFLVFSVGTQRTELDPKLLEPLPTETNTGRKKNHNLSKVVDGWFITKRLGTVGTCQVRIQTASSQVHHVSSDTTATGPDGD